MYTISKKSAVNLSLKFPDINRNGQGADGKVLNFTNNQRNANPSAGVSFLSYCEKFNENTQDQGKCERMGTLLHAGSHGLVGTTSLKGILATRVGMCQEPQRCA